MVRYFILNIIIMTWPSLSNLNVDLPEKILMKSLKYRLNFLVKINFSGGHQKSYIQKILIFHNFCKK